MRLTLNTVLSKIIDGSKIRVIFIDRRHNVAYYVSLVGDTAMPVVTELSKLQNTEEYSIIEDPNSTFISENDVMEKHIMQRDVDWEIVNNLWRKHQIDYLRKSLRGSIVKEHAKIYNISERKLKRLMSKFLQKGMSKNALLSGYINSGGRGKDKSSSEKKRGRPRNIPLFDTSTQGINIDDGIKAIFKESIKMHYNSKKKAPLKYTFDKILKDSFSDEYFEDGKKKYLVWEDDQIPTYPQFWYWFNKNNNKKDTFIKRNSETEYMLKLRELTGSSNMETFGPGFRYQIDATIADIYLLNSLNRKHIIGRPVIYAVIDVYSRLIVGLYVGLEGPSWIGALLALDNVMEDKVKFCHKFNVKVTKEEWPDTLLPEIIIADRGELEGYNVNNMINNLNITIENTPPYRGDLKGIVERKFRVYNDKIKHMLPGAIAKQYRERGDRDYRLDAKFTLEDFTSFILESTILHNNSLIEKYDSELGLISDETPSIPSKIWSWGIKNRTCAFVNHDREFVRMNLLPKAKARLSRKGLGFNGAHYTPNIILRSKYEENLNKSFDIVYDPYNVSYIYLMIKTGVHVDFEKCLLSRGSKDKYSGMTFYEMRFVNELQNEINNAEKGKGTQNTVDRNNNIAELIKVVDRKSKEVNKSNRQRTKNIRENRSEEKLYHRGESVFDNNTRKLEEITIGKEQESKLKSRLELLKKKRDENSGK